MSPLAAGAALSDREDWCRLGMHVRLGLRPDEPRLISCLDMCGRPLSALGALVSDDASARRLQVLARRFAAFSYNPADPGCC